MKWLSSRSVPAGPGVYRLAWLGGPSVIPLDELDAAAAARDDMLRGRTEILFHQLYDVVALRLAAEFGRLTEPDSDDVARLARLAESMGLQLDDNEPVARDPVVDRIVWRNAARATTLTLFDFLEAALADDAQSAHGRDPQVEVKAADWAYAAAAHARFDRDYFIRISGLVGQEVDRGLEIAAHAATEWSVFAAPGAQLLYGERRTVVLAQPEMELLECVWTDSPTIAYLETTAAAAFREDNLVVPAAESVVQAISMPLFWRPEEEGITVAAGDGSRVVPSQCSLKLRFDGAHVRSTDDSLAFEADRPGATVAIPAADVLPLGADRFLLKAHVEHPLR